VRKIPKKVTRLIYIYRKGHDFLGHALCKGNNIFILWASRVSKDAGFYEEFKNINLP
jgi:hypothetical protein